jgi:hypothetical protein
MKDVQATGEASSPDQIYAIYLIYLLLSPRNTTVLNSHKYRKGKPTIRLLILAMSNCTYFLSATFGLKAENLASWQHLYVVFTLSAQTDCPAAAGSIGRLLYALGGAAPVLIDEQPMQKKN